MSSANYYIEIGCRIISKRPITEEVPVPCLELIHYFYGHPILNSTFISDLFSDLTPVPVHQALAAYEVRKTEIVNGEIARLRESTQVLNGYVFFERFIYTNEVNIPVLF